jgi:hypothetical protein
VGLLFLIVWSLLVAGCGGDDVNVTPPNPTDAGADRKDMGTPDMGMDRGMTPDGDGAVTPDGDGATTDGDATVDVPVDRGSDVPVDRGPDVTDARTEEAGPPVLVSIDVTPTNPSIAKGTTGYQFTATGKYSDNSTQNLTATVQWQSVTMSVATIDNTGKANALTVGTSIIRATSGAIIGSTTLTVTQAVLVSLVVNPTNPSIASGTSQPFTAIGTYSDTTTQDITTSVTWASSSPGVATINSAGRAAGQAPGTTTIRATFGTVTNTTVLTVTPAVLVSISVTPSNPSIANYTTRQFTATGLYSDGTTQDLTATATWSSTVDTIATVSDVAGSKGFATAVSPGTTTIRAQSGTVVGSTILTVKDVTLSSIAINPTTPSIPKGLKQKFTAIGTFSDNTTQDITQTVTWNCDDAGVASISNVAGPTKGEATSVGLGTCNVTATQLGQIGTTTLRVTDAILQSINVEPPNPAVPKGSTQPFTATGIYSDGSTQNLTLSASWSSSDASVATINPATGVATAVTPGATFITATSGGIAGSVRMSVTPAQLSSISVTPPNPSIAKGTQVQFTAIGTYTDGSTLDLTASVAWDTSDHNIATIDNSAGSDGVATGLAVGGPINVTATQGSVVGTATLRVTAATLVSITVTPAFDAIPKGFHSQYTATGTYSDGTAQNLTTLASWATSDRSSATVNATGEVTAVNPGHLNITATYQGVSGVTGLTVTPAALTKIDVTPTNPSIAKGTQLQFAATGTYTDNSTQDLTNVATWQSSDGTKASVATGGLNRGLATALDVGSSDISATYTGVSGKTTLTVTMATLSSIAISPVNPSIAKGTSQPFTATGTYSDGTVQDLTATAAWNSSDMSVATIDAAGLASSVNTGTTTIRATSGSVSGTTTLRVTPATLVSIAVTPATPTLANGTTQQFVATGTYTDMSTQNITLQVSWSSANSSIVAIVPSGPARGFATATGVGMANVTATSGTVSGSTLVNVSAATLDSIDVSPTPVTIANGTKQQFTAIGHFSDGHSQNLTTQATWASTNEGVATVSSAGGSEGLATSIAAGGPISITATFGTVTGTASLTVSNATLASITVLPDAKAVSGAGVKVQYTATGHFTSGPDQDLTTQVVWSSSNTAVAIISNNPSGEATSIGNGTTNIRATFTSSGVFGQTTLTVGP